MPRRSPVGPDEMATLDNLARAFHRAARGKAPRPEVIAFRAELDRHLADIGEELRSARLRLGGFRSFRIHDPKPRTIHAPVFRDRVIHHAMMGVMGPVMERNLVDDTFACREGKGGLAAVLRAQAHHRRYGAFVKVDMRSYFGSIDHGVLRALLARRFKHPKTLDLCDQLLSSHDPDTLGRGLPIGALSSQHFANLYLAPLDRFLLEHLRVRGMVRYMDDVVAWVDDAAEGRRVLGAVSDFVAKRLKLQLHPRAFVERTDRPLGFLGFRVRRGSLGLSKRRRRRYHQARRRWERAYRLGQIDARELQAVASALASMVAHANSAPFCRASFDKNPPVDA